MPVANLERGSRRLTWVLSVLFSLPVVALGTLYMGDERDRAVGYMLFGLAVVVFAFCWCVFFVVRWIARGFQGAPSKEPESAAPDDMNVTWMRRLLRPFVRPYRFAYFGRPHCRYPWARQDSWGVMHVVCGDLPVDTIDVKALEGILARLKSGDATTAEVLPGLLSAMTDESGILPVCESHRASVSQTIDEMFSKASEQEQQAFKEWMSTQRGGPHPTSD
jgi:hypothetical protein